MPKTLSQRAAKESLNRVSEFEGGVYITRNGVAELYIQTVEEKAREDALREQERQAVALVKLINLAEEDIKAGRVFTEEEALAYMKKRRSQ